MSGTSAEKQCKTHVLAPTNRLTDAQACFNGTRGRGSTLQMDDGNPSPGSRHAKAGTTGKPQTRRWFLGTIPRRTETHKSRPPWPRRARPIAPPPRRRWLPQLWPHRAPVSNQEDELESRNMRRKMPPGGGMVCAQRLAGSKQRATCRGIDDRYVCPFQVF